MVIRKVFRGRSHIKKIMLKASISNGLITKKLLMYLKCYAEQKVKTSTVLTGRFAVIPS